jgi:hypothetical protein
MNRYDTRRKTSSSNRTGNKIFLIRSILRPLLRGKTHIHATVKTLEEAINLSEEVEESTLNVIQVEELITLLEQLLTRYSYSPELSQKLYQIISELSRYGNFVVQLLLDSDCKSSSKTNPRSLLSDMIRSKLGTLNVLQHLIDRLKISPQFQIERIDLVHCSLQILFNLCYKQSK